MEEKRDGGVDNCVSDRGGETEKEEVQLLIVCVMLVLISHTDRKVGRDTMTWHCG